MSFIAAALIVVSILLGVLMVTSAHLLARVMRLEAVGQRRAERQSSRLSRRCARSPVAECRERCGAQRPRADRRAPRREQWLCELQDRDRRTVSRRVDERDRTSIVVAHEADRLLLPEECAVTIVTSPALVDAVRAEGLALPVTVRVEQGVVIAVEADAQHRIGRRDV